MKKIISVILIILMITSLGCSSKEVISSENEMQHHELDPSLFMPEKEEISPSIINKENNPIKIGKKNGKTIYLTFDDGPSQYTSSLLDYLDKYDKYDVKVTFFVTNMKPEFVSNIGRAFNAKHAIGVHTYCHDYDTIYSSEEAFIEDFNAMQNVIYNQTGTYSPIFRFPGGSSNTVSKKNAGIMSRLTEIMNQSGAVYFDWNVDSGDAEKNASNSNDLIERVKKEVVKHNNSIVLMHDTKSGTVESIEQIIIWGLEEGYTFAALDINSPTVHHKIAN